MPSKKCNIFNKSAGHHIFYEWPLYAPLHKKLSLWSFRRKYCTTKDGAQTYDFIADKRCLLFSIILKVLSGWDSYQNTGKMYKIIYKNLWKDFVVEQNLTRLKGDFWCFFNRQYEIVVIWDDWEYGSLVSIIIVFNCTRGRGLGLGRESNLKLEIAYFKNGKKGLGCWWDIFTTRIEIWGNWKQKKNRFLRISGLWPAATLPH